MNRIMSITLLFLIMTMFCFAEPRIIFRVAEHPPYYFSENGIWKGLSVELINILLKEAGFSVVYKELPWKRALVDMKYGNIDVMANLSITDERNEFIHFIGPQMDESMLLFLSKDSEYVINNLDDIKRLPGKIGIQIGVYYGEEFNKKLETDKDFKSKFNKITDGNLYLNLYQSKRLIGFIFDRYVFYYNQSINGDYKELKEHSFVINQNLIYFGFSKTNFSENDVVKLQEAYNRVKERGDFKIILDKYRGSFIK